ncbi:GNAT family N-acetyltransferase [Xaviernesmea oryzae]|uniref:GNAT family N-acetyltransferase n=1 Tax=Xaviernesmea oryzae TaxID=464029 RepID=A0A1Q9AXC1_9HYPH|nr:GNAT family N-acetyltransferase [Xaviernesmea oryzae]OLP60085.1 GNAT family N-acetyltransferase [Xaviernesmea oryzae]SEK37190.1 putative acetyltransferase [Xaviernesmea oryzae]
MTVEIAQEPPRQQEIEALLALSDAYAAALYPAESNHMVDLASLEKPEVRFLVARHQGRIVGCCAMVAAGDGTAEIKRMFVHETARGLKIGRRLLDRLVADAQAAGLVALRLETGIYQPEAIALYRSAGFVDIEPFGNYRPDPLSLFMERRLVG